MKMKKPEKTNKKIISHAPEKLERVKYLRWFNKISAVDVVALSSTKFHPSYVYHVEAGRFVSRGLMVETAIAKALGNTWENI